MSIFRNLYKDIENACYIWRKEMERVVKDEGVLIFFIVVPLVYPLLYSWIYNNETVHDVPVCVVDQSHSSLSRQFIHMCDASADVRVAYYAQDLDEAKSLVSRQLVKGVFLIPSDFETKVLRMEQGVVSVYCDMSLMLTYKAIFQTARLVSLEMGKEIQTKLNRQYTDREEAIAALSPDRSPLLWRAFQDRDAEEMTVFDVLTAGSLGDAGASAIVDQAVQALGSAIKALIYLVDPGKIILYGSLFEDSYYLSRLSSELQEGVDMRHDVSIEKSRYNLQLEDKAACLLAVQDFIDNGGIQE